MQWKYGIDDFNSTTRLKYQNKNDKKGITLMSVNKGLQGSEMVSNAFRSGIFTIRHVNSDDCYIYDGECDPLMIPTTPSVVLENYL